MESGQTKPLFMKIRQITQHTGLPEKLVRKLVKCGKVEHFYSGRTIYVSVQSIEKICINGAVL